MILNSKPRPAASRNLNLVNTWSDSLKKCGRVLVVLVSFLFQLSITLALAALAPICSSSMRSTLIAYSARRICKIFGVQVRVHFLPSAAPTKTTSLVLSNHLLWIDHFVISHAFPERGVMFAEAANIPLVGFIYTRFGAIFVDNHRRMTVRKDMLAIGAALQQRDSIVLFPQARWSGNAEFLPFHTSLTEAAVRHGIAIQPVALRYQKPDGSHSDTVDLCLGQAPLRAMYQHLVEGPLIADLFFLPTISTTDSNRKAVTRAAESAIRHCLEHVKH